MNKFNLRRVLAMAACLVASVAMFAQTRDIFVGGAEAGKATVWKNEIPEYLSENGEISSVMVVGGNVYAAGKDETVAKVWKNGTLLYSLIGAAYNDIFVTSMVVSGSDIYVTTYEFSPSWEIVGRLWKNGVEQSGYDNAGEMNSVFIDGSDVYVAGKTTDNIGVIWKNGIPLYTYDSESDGSFVSVIVADGSVYYMGGDYNGDVNSDGYGVKIWKNGEILYTLGEVYGGSLYYSEGIIYASGQTPNGGIYQAKVWVNGAGTVLGDGWGSAESVFVFGNDVYVAGFYGDYPEIAAVLWKNGEIVTLSSGGMNSANSVFVAEKTMGTSEIESKGIKIYPNPVKDILYFSEEVSNVKIADISGRMIKELPVSGKSINVSGFTKGSYIITATAKSGKTVSKKFIKE